MRNKKGQFLKGLKPWNKGVKGLIPWNKGLTKETDSRINYERPTAFKKGHPAPETAFKKGYDVTKHWNWQGGKTALSILIRHSEVYKNWSKVVKTRDSFTCQNCNGKGGYLETDHIKPFSILLSENNIKTLGDAINCSKLWDIDNGRTLCKPCHYKIGWNFFKEDNPRKKRDYDGTGGLITDILVEGYFTS